MDQPQPTPLQLTPTTLSSRFGVFGYVVLVVVAMTSIQSGAAIAKQLFPFVGAAGATALRLVFAAIILWIVLRPWRVRLSRRTWRSVLVYGVALSGLNGLFYAALLTVPLGIATALEFTGPLAVAMFSSRRPIDFLWILLAVVGLVVLLPLGEVAGGVDPIGAAFALGAGVCWAMYIVFGQKAGVEHGVQTTAIGVSIAALCVLPFGIVEAGSNLLMPEILPLALGVALLSTALPYSLEMVALRRLPTKTFGTLMSLEPAIAAMSGLILLQEQLAGMQWLAIGAIVAASVGTTATASTKEEIPTLVDPPAVGSEMGAGSEGAA
jgi:inner membrane transporter RhtA